MTNKYFFFILFILSSNINFGQTASGKWHNYLSYRNTQKIAISPKKIYCATSGGIIYYNIPDNSINRLSEIVELSGSLVETINYNQNNKTLIIVYDDCNIDLYYDNKIINLPDIKRKNITGKKINRIFSYNSEVFLSCSFGIVVINLNKNELKDSYIIGAAGSYSNINDIAIYGGNIYAATDNGILKANIENHNLRDYKSWIKIDNIPHKDEKFKYLQVFNNKLIATFSDSNEENDKIYLLNNGSWSSFFPEIKNIYDIQGNDRYLSITNNGNIFLIDNNYKIIKQISHYQFDNIKINPIHPMSSGLSDNNTLWIADHEHSLIKHSGNYYEQILLNGPINNKIYSLHQSSSGLWVSPGSKTRWEQPRFEFLKNGEWHHFTSFSNPELSNIVNIISIKTNPLNEGHFFLASWGSGILEYNNNKFINHYSNHNSPLETALPEQPTEPYVRIGGIDFDSDGNLWITNSEVKNILLKLSKNGQWESFYLPEATNTKTDKLIVTKDNDKWILLPNGGGIYVVNNTGKLKQKIKIISYFNNGETEIYNPMNDIFCIAEDLDGAIWIGTSKGIAVYTTPKNIWLPDPIYAIQPNLNLGDGLYHPLLASETVTAVAIDGANNKWIGTESAGVYLVSKNGDNEIFHFTSDNSPLLSDKILDIAVNKNTGEVFFGTSKGLISYMGNTIEGRTNYKDMFVYPNPVRETYNGPITITGLIEGTEIKITDISGNLVHQNKSTGGQVIWDGNNLNGKRVHTGVYLIFCTNKSGDKTHIEKLLFIH